MRFAFLAVVLLSVLMPSSAVMAGDKKGVAVVPASRPAGGNWALVIGIDGYTISPLDYCVKDASLLAETLRQRCGYHGNRVYLMTDGQKEFSRTPTRRNILKTARLVAELPGDEDTLLLYFSGHGVSIADKGYLVPIDAERVDRSEELVSVAELRGIISHSRARRRVMILDACHSGGEKAGADASMSKSFEQALGADSEGIVTLASCRAAETSLEAPWHQQGLFTYWLTQGLAGAADRECVGNKDNIVELTELYPFVYERVRNEAASRRNHRQNPALLAVISGRIELARVAVTSAPAETPETDRPDVPPSSEVVQDGGSILVTVSASGATTLELLQNARDQARDTYARYAIGTLKSQKSMETLRRFARDHEQMVEGAASPGKAVRFVFSYPVP